MNQLKMRNPQQVKKIQELMNNNGNPREILQNTIKGYTPEQMQNFVKFANSMGISNEQLSQFGINI